MSRVRYTHYSLLRTIEGALGLGTLTRNDRYAQPVNDVFSPGRPSRHRHRCGGGCGSCGGLAPPGPGLALLTGAGHTAAAARNGRAEGGSRGADGRDRPASTSDGDPDAGGDAGGGAGANRAAASDRLRGEFRRRGSPIGLTSRRRHGDQGRREPAGDRDRAGRQYRLRRQLRLEHGHPDQYRHRPPGPAIPAGQALDSLAVTPGSAKVFVTGGDSDTVTAITAATGREAAASRWGTRGPRSPSPRRVGRPMW